MPKRDKLGIHRIVEEKSLKILSKSIDTALRSKIEKVQLLSELRREIETLKHIIRIENELGIIKEKIYLELSHLLVDISMMATGWQKSLQTQKPLI
jgi:hypothetical protein